MGNPTRNNRSLLKKITAAGLAPLLLVAGLPLPAAAAAESCKDWGTAKFFGSATVGEVRACLSAGARQTEPERTVPTLQRLHRGDPDRGAQLQD